MWRAALLAASAIGCAGCDRGAPPASKHVDRDPCTLVTQADATALLGQPAIKKPSGPGACEWGFELPDQSRGVLRLEIKDTASLPKPVIFSAKPVITYEGRPVVADSSIAEPMAIGSYGFITASDAQGVDIRWFHADSFVEIALVPAGPSAPSASTKIDDVKRLARKVEAAL